MQGKALAEANAIKRDNELKMRGEDEEGSKHAAPKFVAPASNEEVIKRADAEGKAMAEADAKAAESWLPDEHALMGDGRKETQERDASWRAAVAAEAKGERQAFAHDQKSIEADDAKVQTTMAKATSGDKKVDTAAKVAEEKEEKEMESEANAITGGVDSEEEDHAASPHHGKAKSGGHHISIKAAEAAVKALQGENTAAAKPASASTPAAPVKPETAAEAKEAKEASFARLQHQVEERKAEEKEFEANQGEAASVVPRHATGMHAPRHVMGGHRISVADAEAAVKKLEAEEAHKTSAAPEPAAAAVVHKEEGIKADAAPTVVNGHITMAAAEAAVKKLEAEEAAKKK